MKYDLIIIGSGSVGAAAGYYATRAGLKVLMSEPVLVLYEHAFDLSRDDRGVERLWSGFLSLRWLA